MMSVGLHCRLAGRPGKLAGLERFLKHALGHQDVWFCRRIEIARHWRATHPARTEPCMSQFDELRRHYINLAQPRLGAEVVHATDDFFADKARLIDPAEPVFIPGKYDENGKWMDGWESRRKRVPGHDWCVVRLGVPGVVAGFEIDTRHFTGNYPPGAEIEVCRSVGAMPNDEAGWTKVTPRLALNGDDRIYVPGRA